MVNITCKITELGAMFIHSSFYSSFEIHELLMYNYESRYYLNVTRQCRFECNSLY
jgi:hypothetical protein